MPSDQRYVPRSMRPARGTAQGAKLVAGNQTRGEMTYSRDRAPPGFLGGSNGNEPMSGPGVTCELIEDVDEDCANQAILKCNKELGAWSL